MTIDLLAYTSARQRAHIDAKSEQNERALGRLRNMESLWDGLNADVEADNQTHFDQMEREQSATAHAAGLLDENPCQTLNPNAWTIAGKIVDEKTRVGVPGIQVRIVLGEKALDADVTDTWGNFKLMVSERVDNSVTFDFEVMSDAETIFHRESRVLSPRFGAIERLTFAVPCEEPVQGRLEAGTGARESVLADIDLVKQRLENMNGSRDLLNRLNTATLHGLRQFITFLSEPPPNPGGNAPDDGGDSPDDGGFTPDSGETDDNGDPVVTREEDDPRDGGGPVDEEEPRDGGGTVDESLPWVIEGQVIDNDLEPVAGATIFFATLTDPDGAFAKQVTNDRGFFTIQFKKEDLPTDAASGLTIFVVDDGGEQIGAFEGPLFFKEGDAVKVQIRTGSSDTGPGTWTIKGQVKRPRGRKRNGLEVFIMQPGTKKTIGGTLTDENGAFTMTFTNSILNLAVDGKVTLGLREDGDFIFLGRKEFTFEPGATITENIGINR